MMTATAKKNFQTAFAAALLSYRKAHGLSQSKMARLLDMHERSYIDLEHGKFCPSAITLLTFIGALPVDDRATFLENLISLQ